MKIIIDGPDGTGKTTLAKELSIQLDWPIKHLGVPKTKEEKLGMFDMYIEEASKAEHAIYDRWAYSEMVYGPLMRRASYIDALQMQFIERTLLTNGGAIWLYCTCEPTTSWKRAQTRGEEYITDYTVHEAIHSGFNKLAKVYWRIIPMVPYGTD